MAELNQMCNGCTNTDCGGTTAQVWTGCVYRTTEGNKNTEALQIARNCYQQHRGNWLAVYADLCNQCTELADTASTERECSKLDALILARDSAEQVLAREYLQANGWQYDTSGHYPKWIKTE